MIFNAKDVEGFQIYTKDEEEMGRVDGFLFDDEQWTIRYLVLDTRKWLPGRTVVISPASIQAVDMEEKRVLVQLTKNQVKGAPDLDAKQPVSRRKELEFHKYYGLNPYWFGAGIWGPGATPAALLEQAAQGPDEREDDSSHLRQTVDVQNYRIHALDGDIGHIETFLIDDTSWQIRYVVVDTRNWLPGKKVLLSPLWFTDIDWFEARAYVELHKKTIEEAPEYDPNIPVTREYEERLHRVFRRPPYWGQ